MSSLHRLGLLGLLGSAERKVLYLDGRSRVQVEQLAHSAQVRDHETLVVAARAWREHEHIPVFRTSRLNVGSTELEDLLAFRLTFRQDVRLEVRTELRALDFD